MTDGMIEARSAVEAAIRTLSLDPGELLTKDGADQIAWTLKRGSAAVLVMLLRRPDRSGSPCLRVVSPTMVFDPATREALFARALSLNADGMTGCAFGLMGDRLVVVTERSVIDLSQDEVTFAIKSVAAVSDTWDDKLVAEFGGKRAADV